jgi:hypothetical protein
MATTVAKEAMATRYMNTASHSITKFFESPFAGKCLKLISKGTKAAAAEAAVTAAEGIAVEAIEEARRLAAEFEAFGGGASTMALAQDAEPGTTCASAGSHTSALACRRPVDQSWAALEALPPREKPLQRQRSRLSFPWHAKKIRAR